MTAVAATVTLENAATTARAHALPASGARTARMLGALTIVPAAAIASAAMLLRYALDADTEATTIETAIGSALDDGLRTADLALDGQQALGCQAMIQAIIDRLE